MSEILARSSGVYLDCLNNQLPDTYPEKHELREDKDFEIYQYVLDFKPEKKMKFSTYVGQRIKWKCLNIYNRTLKPEDREKTLEDSLDNSYEENFEDIDGSVIDHLHEFVEKYPDERARFIFSRRYLVDKPVKWVTLSQELGLSLAQCGVIHKKLIKDAQKFLIKTYQ